MLELPEHADPTSLIAWRNAIASKYGPPSPVTRHVLLTLSLHFNFELEGWPSIRLLTVRSGLSRRAVLLHLQTAKKLGWLSVTRTHRQSVYTGLWPEPLYPEQFSPGQFRASECT